ncbi:hypothetical protein [Turneriella parva]|uniref:Uncharacterized protein n=1 Tax=Turneriella parva (strain ATCC BAA-1111 / DSM 21527 / NCTC 11395 / H) TaxID=869212 RepID=I4B303_TURPD|nr:hypothetical protein [Turneriella parva]AFM11660.1 hypothetical protein Turpa_1011 [Turneriella parva DSM 21527]
MIKRIAVVFLTCVPLAAENAPTEKKSIEYDGETYFLAHTDATADQALEEYLREGETLENWTKMVSVRAFKNFNDPKEIVRLFVAALKKQHPDAPYEAARIPETREIMLDFVTWPADGSYAEINIWKFRKVSVGVVAFQFALRKPDTRAVLADFKKTRPQMLKVMAGAQFAAD